MANSSRLRRCGAGLLRGGIVFTVPIISQSYRIQTASKRFSQDCSFPLIAHLCDIEVTGLRFVTPAYRVRLLTVTQLLPFVKHSSFIISIDNYLKSRAMITKVHIARGSVYLSVNKIFPAPMEPRSIRILLHASARRNSLKSFTNKTFPKGRIAYTVK